MTTRTLPALARLKPRRVMSWLLLLALGATVSTSGCAKGTYLEVRVSGGPNLPEVHGIRMALTLRPASDKPLKAVDVLRNDKGGAIKIPATMAFSLDDDTGALLLEATALGIDDAPVATGSALTTIMRDKTWIVPIDLNPL
jgi:hypothetical protein